MSVTKKYIRYLDHFKQTTSLIENNKANCSLRHDVDYSIDAALEMAFIENYYGFTSTYFILPYASYWNDTRLISKILQIQDFGHEIGIHFNGIADWIANRNTNIESDFDKILSFLRASKIEISGISSHGDSLCYQYNFINYWAFSNLKPDNPPRDENNRTAEGIVDISSDNKKISYPLNELLRRADGSIFKLWSIDFKKYNIKYDAWHTKFDKYYSDSGGLWKRSPDPLGVKNFNQYKSQVLIHPEYWLDSPKTYFFLGSARSGSTWLTNILNTSTNVSANHEYILNNDMPKINLMKKRTHNVKHLEKNSNLRKTLFVKAWEEIAKKNNSYAEVNIYLENFIDDLKSIFKGSEFIYIYRDKKKIITSLINRGWYLSFPDIKRPNIKMISNYLNKSIFYNNTKDNSQFIRVLAYILNVKNNLNNQCNYQLNMDKAFINQEYLSKTLYKFGIYFYPRLSLPIYSEKVNLNKVIAYQSFNDLPEEKKNIYSIFNLHYNKEKFNLFKKKNKICSFIFDFNPQNDPSPILNKLCNLYIFKKLLTLLNFFQYFFQLRNKNIFSVNKSISHIKIQIRIPKKIYFSGAQCYIEEYSNSFLGIGFRIFKRRIFILNNQKKIFKIKLELHPNTKYFRIYTFSNNMPKDPKLKLKKQYYEK